MILARPHLFSVSLHALLAQLVERMAVNHKVVGSIPTQSELCNAFHVIFYIYHEKFKDFLLLNLYSLTV